MFNILNKTEEFKKLLKSVNEPYSKTALFGLPLVGRAQIISELVKQTNRQILILTSDESQSTRLCNDINFFGVPASVFPARDLTIRDIESQNNEYEHRRLSVLGDVIGKRTKVIASSIEAFLQYTVPKNDFCNNTLTIKQGESLEIKILVEKLYNAGYNRRDKVEGIGQFSVRGGIVDIYAADMQKPARLEFWGDEIENIYTFDTLSQRRENEVKKIHISPSKEVLMGSALQTLNLINSFAEKLKKNNKEQFLKCIQKDINNLKNDIMPVSLDKYLNIKYTSHATIFDFLDNPIIFIDENRNLKEVYKSISWRINEDTKTLLEQGVITSSFGEFYADYEYLLNITNANNTIISETFSRSINDYKLNDIINFTAHTLPTWKGDINSIQQDIAPLVSQGYFCVILAGTHRSCIALEKDLRSNGFKAVYCKNDVVFSKGCVAILKGSISSGIEYPFTKLAVFTIRNIGNDKKSKKKNKGKGISNLEDLKLGDIVVEQNHGIGRYDGIKTLNLQGVVKDYIKIIYEKNDVLFVPVTNLDTISRYTSPVDSEKVKLAKLGTTQWQASKNKVKKEVEVMAKELIELYAKRKESKGYAFPPDNDWQHDFETRFEYDETDDQLKSINDIKKDMESPQPMERLVCGDVGVGKTEVALRAAFKCVMGGKQCAILVPTTILAWQHYETIVHRMSAFPVKIGLLSRFRTPKQQKETIQDIKTGVIDIVVGTHRLLQKDVNFKDLGLVIIDEEQRFGVKHKEKLKKTFIGVDNISLSATPIPRTLNMALSGIRDMSSIEEPPQERQPIETYVLEYDANVIEMAIKKELARAGQVYYLHNRVETIELCASKLQALVPEARIGIAHGKMDEKELSLVWQELIDGEIDILVCTTIIETGIDVRNCNTLIIENANHMGLSQLYQIRGRVGRSSRKAYAYFTFKKDKSITEIAEKRLSAIKEFTSFGSGIKIAMRDLQIRGVGSLLGQSQSGHMQSIGYDMYVKLLNQAISIAKGLGLPPDKSECSIDITVDAFIPNTYISAVPDKIEAYKKIAAIENEKDANDILEELNDRYGKIIPSVKGLIDVSLARVVATTLSIYEVVQRDNKIILFCDKYEKEQIKQIIRISNREITLSMNQKPSVSLLVNKNEKPIEVLNEFLTNLKNLNLKNLNLET